MATTLTPNLKLRVDSNLTASAKYNLNRIDALGAVFQLDNTNAAVIRSAEGIVFRPNDTTVGGTGSGGSVQFGAEGQPVESVAIHADSFEVNAPLSLADQGTAGNKKLLLQYDSTLNGPVDTAADRTLKLDLDGADRQLVLGGDFSLTGGSLTLTASSNVAWALPAADAAGSLTNDGAGNLSWSPLGGTSTTSDTWTSGTTKTITHGWGTRKVLVQVLDIDDSYRTIDADVTRPTNNTVVLDASEAPTGSGWLVILSETL